MLAYYCVIRPSRLGPEAGCIWNTGRQDQRPAPVRVKYGTVDPDPGTPLYTINELEFSRKRSYAAYAALGYDLTDSVNVSVAGRYSYETQQTASNHGAGTDLLPDPRGKVAFKRFTPRATIRYAINPTSNIYASYSQGFKSGYVNPTDSPVPPLTAPVRPEKVFAYEIGYKGRPAQGIAITGCCRAFSTCYSRGSLSPINLGGCVPCRNILHRPGIAS